MPANRTASLVAREGLGGAYFLLTFLHPEAAREAQAGQFVMIKAGVSAEPPLRRPFAPPADGEEALMVGGGYGVAPFGFLGGELRRRGGRARLFYGGRTSADLPLLKRLKQQGLEVVPATEDGTTGAAGRVTVPLEAHLDATAGARRLYACGPEAMMHAVARIAAARGLPAQVSLDPWMGCGVGTCLGCVVRIQRAEDARWKYRCACTEGPVFEAANVVWPGEAESHARQARAASSEARA